MTRPILSIVIANYNYGRFLETALESIFSQCEDESVQCMGRLSLRVKGADALIEVIICDAASGDNSVDVIKKYSDKIAWWCSEKDKGQSDAFNKGFAQAQGEFITWLNSDEIYTRGTFVALWKYIERHPKADWITSNDYAFSDTGSLITYICWGPHHQIKSLSANHSPAVAFGPSSFMRRSMYEKVGPFDIDIHYGMDMTYWHRLTKAGFRQSRLNRFSWGFRVHSESKTAGVQTETITKRRNFEDDIVASRYGRQFQYSWENPWYAFWILCRLLDGSLITNLFLRLYLKGKDARMVWKGLLWK